MYPLKGKFILEGALHALFLASIECHAWSPQITLLIKAFSLVSYELQLNLSITMPVPRVQFDSEVQARLLADSLHCKLPATLTVMLTSAWKPAPNQRACHLSFFSDHQFGHPMGRFEQENSTLALKTDLSRSAHKLGHDVFILSFLITQALLRPIFCPLHQTRDPSDELGQRQLCPEWVGRIPPGHAITYIHA